MAQTSYKQSDFFSGQANNLNSAIMPKNSVDLAVNMEFDEELGSAVSRLGSSQIGSQLVASVSVLGLVQHVDQADTTKNKLFATVNDGTSPTNADIYDVVGGTVSLADDTKSLKTYFLNLAGDTLRLNGTDAAKAYNSTSWITTGGVFDLANIPSGYKYPKEFLDRVYLWGNASTPYRLAYSGLLTTGTVSWTSGNGTVDIEPEDNGGEATGLAKVPGYLLIFKRRSLKRWNFSSAFPESLVQIGAYSQESIIEGAGLVAFYSDSNEDAKGFYITNGGRPECISGDNTRPIKKWVDAISATANVAGWATDRTFAWSVGDLTVDGESYTNVVLRYNRILNQWSVRSYPNELKVFAHYVASGIHSTLAGDDNGNIWRIDQAGKYQDGSTDISYKLRSQSEDFGVNNKKRLTDRMVIASKGAETALVSILQDDNINKRVQLGQITREICEIPLTKPITGNSIQWEIAGKTVGARAYINEVELPHVEILPNYA